MYRGPIVVLVWNFFTKLRELNRKTVTTSLIKSEFPFLYENLTGKFETFRIRCFSVYFPCYSCKRYTFVLTSEETTTLDTLGPCFVDSTREHDYLPGDPPSGYWSLSPVRHGMGHLCKGGRVARVPVDGWESSVPLVNPLNREQDARRPSVPSKTRPLPTPFISVLVSSRKLRSSDPNLGLRPWRFNTLEHIRWIEDTLSRP